MEIGLPYGLTKETSIRLLGLYAWLCDEEANPGCIENGKWVMTPTTPTAENALSELRNTSLDIKPLECVAYFPYAHIVNSNVQTGHFKHGSSIREQKEWTHCSIVKNRQLTVVLRCKLDKPVVIGNVAEPSRRTKKWMDAAGIFSHVWTSIASPYWVFIAIPDDPCTVMRVASIFRARQRTQ